MLKQDTRFSKETAKLSDVECRTTYCGQHHSKFMTAWRTWTKFCRTAQWGNRCNYLVPLTGLWPRWSQSWLLNPTLCINISEIIISGSETPFTKMPCNCLFSTLVKFSFWPLFPFKCCKYETSSFNSYISWNTKKCFASRFLHYQYKSEVLSKYKYQTCVYGKTKNIASTVQ